MQNVAGSPRRGAEEPEPWASFLHRCGFGCLELVPLHPEY